MTKLEMKINSNVLNYPIFIDNEPLESLKEKIDEICCNKNYIVIFSEKVYKLYSKILNFPKDKIFILKDGEKEKNYKNYIKIINFALSRKLKREDYIIAAGGGVAGDITGFAAATYMRGVNFIQIPTTLLAMTDSSVGGKTAINTNYGKNLVGAFYQPKAVFVNTNFLKTLDFKQYKSGLGEVLKYGFIEKSCNAPTEINLLNFLTENYEKILNKDAYIMNYLISGCISLKIAVVQQDEKEGGLRRILNYGHTYGHVLEKLTGYKRYTHGECVVEGIRTALMIAAKLNFADKDYRFLCSDIIEKFGYKPLKKFNPDKVISVMSADKKAAGGYIKFILPDGYGMVTEYDFAPDKLKETLTDLK